MILATRQSHFAPCYIIWTTEDGDISDVLRQVELNIIPNITCVESFSAISIVIRDDVICTFKGPLGTESTCSGDSGGPLMVRRSAVCSPFPSQARANL